MNDLKMLAVATGVITALIFLPCLLVPQSARVWIKDFPRSKIAAWILLAVGVVWSAWFLFKMPLAWFDNYKPSLYVLAPLFFLLTVKFMDELLAPRALGGLLLLIPGFMIDIARQRGLLLVTLAYALVVVGIALVLSPYIFRKSMAYYVENDSRCRMLGAAGASLGAVIAVFGLICY